MTSSSGSSFATFKTLNHSGKLRTRPISGLNLQAVDLVLKLLPVPQEGRLRGLRRPIELTVSKLAEGIVILGL